MTKSSEYARRRRQLMRLIGENAIAILPSAKELIRSRDTHFSFRQDSDFHYLTGFDEPESVLVLTPGRKHGEFILFNRERDKEKETWHGRRAGQEGAINDYGADDAFPIDDIDDILPGLIEGRERIYCAIGNDREFDDKVLDWLNTLRTQHVGEVPHGEIIDVRHFLHDMRLYKSAAEIKAMRKAASISAKAHIRAMQVVRPGMNESDIEAELHHEFARNGARFPAYSSIVAGGENACILHYVENDAKLKKNDLLMIDAGAEYKMYAGDISRTFPISGKFTKAQKKVYDWVLKAQIEAIESIRPGATWQTPHEVAVRVLTEALVDLKVLKGKVKELIEQQAFKPYYMHKTGHWIGMDVHDVGDYQVGGEPRVLEPGMVMTVEPGLYFPSDDKSVPKAYRGMGVRIEDDVLVTKDGYEILSHEVPKSTDEIEALMADARAQDEAA